MRFLPSLYSDASHYRNRESLVRRKAAEPHLEDGGIYRKRWWACTYRIANFSLGGDAVGRNASTGTEARGALMAVDDM